MFALDHVFCCVETLGQSKAASTDSGAHTSTEAERLRELGFCVEFRREHVGQGTHNELLLFDDGYLELLYLGDRTEAQAALVRLDRRADWRQSGASPFGVAIRGPKSSAPHVEWCFYTLAGMRDGLWLAQACLDDPRLPLIFLFDEPVAKRPMLRDQTFAPRFFEHEGQAKGIDRAELTGPGYTDTPLAEAIEGVRFAEAPGAKQGHLHLRLRGGDGVRRDVSEPLSLG